ncbi:MAG: lysophospholipase [Firmicutes bacterium]|nr:lysophospholipase [Bacillota bacterium]
MKKEFFFPSMDGVTKIHGIEWIPEGDPVGILQMCHGMVEHIDRYDAFASFLAAQGFYVVGHDHLGHGRSVTNDKRLGYFHHPNGNDVVVADIHQLRVQTQEKYPKLPYFIMGHSMGSFLVRQYLGLHSEDLAGAIIMGTGHQPNGILSAGMFMCRLISLFRGWEYRSKMVNDMAVGGYAKKLGSAWLSKNPENQENYSKDPLCGFMFTVNAYYHMFKGMSRMNKQEAEGRARKDLPLFFVAGGDDPVGESGKGVEKVVSCYREKGYQNVQMKLYPGDAHEILNELDKDAVYQDLLNFLR